MTTIYKSVILWMANHTVIGGVEYINGQELNIEYTFEQLQDFAYGMAEFCISVQVINEDGSYWSSYVTGGEDDGKLFLKGSRN